jgi:predicted transcriptional regulator
MSPDASRTKHYETSEKRPPLKIYSRTWEDTPNTLIVAEERRDLGWSCVGSVEVSLGPIDARGCFAAEQIAEWSHTQYRANGDRIRVDRRLVTEETDDKYRVLLEKRREQVLGSGRKEHGWQTEDSWSWELPTLVTDGGQPAEDGRAIQHAKNILLSIEPQHAESILAGEKRYEYRRVAPASDPPYRFVLYASAPVQAAVGVMWSQTKKTEVPENVVRNTVVHTPHDAEDVLEYLDGVEEGHALRADAYRRFDEPVPREDLVEMGAAPSQNFRYIGEVPYRPTSLRIDGVLPE